MTNMLASIGDVISVVCIHMDKYFSHTLLHYCIMYFQ